jgi:hypothetical protein
MCGKKLYFYSIKELESWDRYFFKAYDVFLNCANVFVAKNASVKLFTYFKLMFNNPFQRLIHYTGDDLIHENILQKASYDTAITFRKPPMTLQ